MSKEKTKEVVIDDSSTDATEDATIIENVVAKSIVDAFSVSDIRVAFEQGAAWQREHHYNPQAMNAVEAAKEAASRWPE
jgi:hypothetical protein